MSYRSELISDITKLLEKSKENSPLAKTYTSWLKIVKSNKKITDPALVKYISSRSSFIYDFNPEYSNYLSSLVA